MKYIRDIYREQKNVLAFEVFPPKKESNFDSVKAAVDKLCTQSIDYMSVTYGAGGSTSKSTAGIASHIQDELGVCALAHLTCVSATRSDIYASLDDLKKRGITNILALRGDIPKNSGYADPKEYRYASELIEDIRAYGGFCIGAACYPEGHPNSADLDEDIENLKKKVDAGAEFLVSQLFFDNDLFYEFRDKAAAKGINVPIEAGIMPLTTSSQIQKMCVLSGGAVMPRKFTRMFARYESDPAALKQAGIAYAVDQICDLLSGGVDGIHIYTMNKPEVAEKIVGAVGDLFERKR